MRRLFIAATWPALRTLVPDFRIREDLYILTNHVDSSRRLMGLLPRSENTFLVSGWGLGEYSWQVERDLRMRLARSGDKLEDCKTIY